MENIPVVDFSKLRLGSDNISDEELLELSGAVKAAFTGLGFLYLRNTGVEEQEVGRVFSASKKFFLLPEEKKRPYSRGGYSINVNHGWVSSETERLNPRRPGDLKESFNTTSLSPEIKWPTEDVAEFREVQVSFYRRCGELALRVLRVMALSLGRDAELFLEAHRLIGSEGNGSTLRSLYYPPVRSEEVKEDQLRCGEHSDYGSITLVFQSQEGGLQVLSREGEYISAPSLPGTVLVNIADLMQRWTSDVFVSAVHRVLLPPPGDLSPRQSLVFFVQPDDDALITCFDGSDKYPPIRSEEYLLSRFKDSYGNEPR